jgi:alpha-L-rhamnosidase
MDDSSGGKRLWTEGTHFGDWLSLDASDPESRRGGTPHDFIASAFYCYSARLVAKAARLLGKSEQAAIYARLSTEVKTAIQLEYFTASGRLAAPTQTGYLLALYMDLAADEHRERVIKDFITRINMDNVHLRTGFVGTPYLCRVLSQIGANDLAYRLLLNEDYPSWLYAVNLDATTIWERWNALNPDGSISSKNMRSHSFNHYAYGSIVEWMYRDMCGLNPSTGEDGPPGFRQALIAPKPDHSLQWARARYRSAAGYYESGWRIDEADYLHIDITIPFNASARVLLPDAQLSAITMNGDPLREAEQNADNVALTLGAGCYQFVYRFGENDTEA